MTRIEFASFPFWTGVLAGVVGLFVVFGLVRFSDREIVRVVDGDTVAIAGGENVRLAGFDAPESRRGNAKCESERLAGIAATAELRRLVDEAKRIRLDVSLERDKFGRPLAVLFIDGRNVAHIAVENGWGKRAGEARADWCGGEG